MGSVAAQVMAWQRRARNKPGPLAPVSMPSGDSPNGSFLQVEILLDGIWTDITSRVMVRDGSGGVAVTRGQPNEGSQTEPSSCTLQLNNRDGLFSPRNPASPYYGKLGRNLPLRVSVPSGNDKAYRFWGEVSSWPQKWDTTGHDVWVDLEAGGILRRLKQAGAKIGSDLRVALVAGQLSAYGAVGEVVEPVVAYWPCEDAVGSTVLASAFANSPGMTISGTPTLASFAGFICSDALPVMGNASFTGIVPAYAPGISSSIRFLLAIPGAGASDGQVLCAFTMTGVAPRWECYYTSASGGSLGLRAFGSNGVTLLNGAPPGGQDLNGSLVLVSIDLTQIGPDVWGTVSTGIVGEGTAGGNGGVISSASAGIVTSVTISPGFGFATTAVGHVRVQISTTPTPDMFDIQASLLAHVGETADDRIFRLLKTFSINAHQIGPVEQAVTMGAQLNSTLLGLISDCVTADDGILYETLDGIGLGYRTRVGMENQATALSLNYAAFNLSQALSPVDDDRFTRNDITISRTGGSSARATQTTGSLSIAQPPAGVGTYADSLTVNNAHDSDLPHLAGWRLHVGTTDEARYPTISLNLAHSSISLAMRQQILAVRPGDRITISNPPPWLPPDQISQIVVGFSEQIDHFQHRVTFNCVPESPYRTAVLGDAVLGRLDTGGSAMEADALPTDTSLLIATTTGPVWTTSAGDWPFDIRIAGEQITVTAVSGSVSPQTFTVTRSVNGVTKALPIGADVRLNQPMILAL